MNKILLALATLSLVQVASASSDLGQSDIQKVKCSDSSGKSYQMVWNKVIEGPEIKITSDGKTKTYDGRFDENPFNQLVVSIGSDITGQGQEQQIYLQLPSSKSGIQAVVGTVFAKYYFSLFPVATISCQVQFAN